MDGWLRNPNHQLMVKTSHGFFVGKPSFWWCLGFRCPIHSGWVVSCKPFKVMICYDSGVINKWYNNYAYGKNDYSRAMVQPKPRMVSSFVSIHSKYSKYSSKELDVFPTCGSSILYCSVYDRPLKSLKHTYDHRLVSLSRLTSLVGGWATPLKNMSSSLGW